MAATKETFTALVWQGVNTKTKSGRPQRWRIHLVSDGNGKKIVWSEAYTNQDDAVEITEKAFKKTGHTLLVIDAEGTVIQERKL